MNAHLRYAHGVKWSDRMDDMLRAQKSDGASFQSAIDAINKAFGLKMTRNAAVGRASRIGIPKVERAMAAISSRRHRTIVPLVVKPTQDHRKLNTVHLVKPIGAEAIDLPPATPGPDAVSIAEAGNEHCRWPYGDPRDIAAFRFCGAGRREGSSFCAGHHAMAYTPVTRRVAKRSAL